MKEHDYKRENKSKRYRESDNEDINEIAHKKHNIEKPNEHMERKSDTENIDNPLTDSELNALAAKQIKAELMGNTVSSIFIITF